MIGNDYEMSQLDQLGREWAVVAFCITRDLDSIALKGREVGREKRVWRWSGDESQRTEWVTFVEEENKRYKRLLHCACMG